MASDAEWLRFGEGGAIAAVKAGGAVGGGGAGIEKLRGRIEVKLGRIEVKTEGIGEMERPEIRRRRREL